MARNKERVIVSELTIIIKIRERERERERESVCVCVCVLFQTKINVPVLLVHAHHVLASRGVSQSVNGLTEARREVLHPREPVHKRINKEIRGVERREDTIKHTHKHTHTYTPNTTQHTTQYTLYLPFTPYLLAIGNEPHRKR